MKTKTENNHSGKPKSGKKGKLKSTEKQAWMQK